MTFKRGLRPSVYECLRFDYIVRMGISAPTGATKEKWDKWEKWCAARLDYLDRKIQGEEK